MKLLIRNFLADECNKLVSRHFEYLFQLHDGMVRAEKRLGLPVGKTIRKPEYWAIDDRFNPFIVRRGTTLDHYSEILDKRIKHLSYKPQPAIIHDVAKEDGSVRKTNVYQIPDAAISRLVYKSLLHKNLTRLSAYAYAYREDRGAHDAVHAIHSEWKTLDRVYVAEFDFAKFFDNIGHDYVWRVLDRHGFICSNTERCVLERFLVSETAPTASYKSGPYTPRKRGIPQGTSVSLFLANIACWELDRALERIGVAFARYADDTVVWSSSYEKIVQAYDAIKRYSEMMEVPINVEKSHGVHLISDGKAEISTKGSIDFLGYRISPAAIAIKDGRVEKIKAKISHIAYQNLLQPISQGIFNTDRLGDIDLDYLVSLSQIRRYLYGGLTDDMLRKYIRGQIPRINFVGLMSFYPLVNDSAQLSLLDGWLIHVLKQCLKKRESMWGATKSVTLPGPTPDWISNLTKLKTWTSPSGIRYDLRIPSFTLINKALHVATEKSGLAAATHPGSVYY